MKSIEATNKKILSEIYCLKKLNSEKDFEIFQLRTYIEDIHDYICFISSKK